MTKAEPFTEASEPKSGLFKYMIVLTDGENTVYRYGTNTAEINAKTRALCNDAKKSSNAIRIITIRVIEGDEGLLRDCASPDPDDPSKKLYYGVTNASELTPVFQNIARKITRLRIAA